MPPDGEPFLIAIIRIAAVERFVMVAGGAPCSNNPACELNLALPKPLASELMAMHAMSSSARLYLNPTRRIVYAGGLDADLGGPDELQVHPEDAWGSRQRWVLVTSAAGYGAARAIARSHVEKDSVRLNYAGRVLFGLPRPDGHQRITLQEFPKSKDFHLRDVSEWAGRVVVGAPAMAVRATEAVVGDENRRLVRLDAAVLDAIGAKVGDRVLLSFGPRSAMCEVATQDDMLRDRMKRQLDGTGQQTWQACVPQIPDADFPHHLRAWVSPLTRAELGVTPGCVLRVRRSAVDVVKREVAAALLPISSVVVAGIAVPADRISTVVWVFVGLLFLAIQLAAARVRR